MSLLKIYLCGFPGTQRACLNKGRNNIKYCVGWLKDPVMEDNLSSRPLSLVFSPLQQFIVSPGDEDPERGPASQPEIFLSAVPASRQEDSPYPHNQQRQSQRV